MTNGLISHHFEPARQPRPRIPTSHRSIARRGFCHKDSTGEVLFPRYLVHLDARRPFKQESPMAWKAPKIVEVPVGMEINMYACAARK
jgi:coenzyme PQQ precursor peptide PqqA